MQPSESTDERAAARIFVNDHPRPLQKAATLQQLLEEMGVVGRRGVAVAVNGAVVRRAAWAASRLAEEDRVLIIRATQGG